MKTIRFIGMALLAVLVSISSSACSNSDDEGGDDTNGDATLTVNDQKCNPNKDSYINQNRGALHLSASYISDKNVWNTWEVDIRIIRRSFKVSELEVGETFDYDEVEIEEFRRVTSINMSESQYTMLSGSIVVESVNNKEVKLRFKDLSFQLRNRSSFDGDYYPENPKKNVISGTALFHNYIYIKEGNTGYWEPFY